MTTSNTDSLRTEDLRPFVEAVERFCEVVEQVETLAEATLLRRMDELMPLVYHEAWRLPDWPWDDEDDESEEGWRVYEEREKHVERLKQSLRKRRRDQRRVDDLLKRKLGSHAEYTFVYDPVDPAQREPIQGSLVEDISELYWDLKDALELYRSGDELGIREAIWDWGFGRKQHWGCHAIHAIPVLHSLIQHHYDEDDEVFDV